MTAADQRAALAELRRLLAQATPGPWRQGRMEPWHIFTPHGADIGPDRVVLRMNMANTRDWPWSTDAALIAAAITALPWLLDAAERGLEQDSFPCELCSGLRCDGPGQLCPLCQNADHLGPLICAGCDLPITGPWQHCDGRDYHEGCGRADGKRRTNADS